MKKLSLLILTVFLCACALPAPNGDSQAAGVAPAANGAGSVGIPILDEIAEFIGNLFSDGEASNIAATTADIPEGWYRMRNYLTGGYINCENGALQCSKVPKTERSTSWWHLIPVGNGLYQIQVWPSNKYLYVALDINYVGIDFHMEAALLLTDSLQNLPVTSTRTYCTTFSFVRSTNTTAPAPYWAIIPNFTTTIQKAKTILSFIKISTGQAHIDGAINTQYGNDHGTTALSLTYGIKEKGYLTSVEPGGAHNDFRSDAPNWSWDSIYWMFVPDDGIYTVPLYCYFNPTHRDHLYTTELSYGEYMRVNYGYTQFDGVSCYVYPPNVTNATGSVPLHCYYNPNSFNHFYTTIRDDAGWGRFGYQYRFVACYVYDPTVSYFNALNWIANDAGPLYCYYKYPPSGVNPYYGHHYYTTYRNDSLWDQIDGYKYIEITCWVQR